MALSFSTTQYGMHFRQNENYFCKHVLMFYLQLHAVSLSHIVILFNCSIKSEYSVNARFVVLGVNETIGCTGNVV